jgi:cell division septum initiation protein DivIVA
MFRRTETTRPGSQAAVRGDVVPGAPSADRAVPAELPAGAGPVATARPNGLDSLLTTGPVFPVRVHGYDRLHVDNYVAWAESELAVARGEAEHLLARYGACVAELEISRRLLAEAPRGRDVSPLTDRVRDILRLAADEASSMVESAREEAAQILAEARAEADERLRKAHQVEEGAAATADEMRALASRERAEATGLLERARAEAADMIGSATAERDRLAAESAENREQLTVLRAEAEDLSRRRDDARTVLLRLTEQIEAALALASAGPSERYLMVGNTVAEHPAQASQGVAVPS